MHEDANNLRVLQQFIRHGEAVLRSTLPKPLDVACVSSLAAVRAYMPKNVDATEFFNLVNVYRSDARMVYSYTCTNEYLQYVTDPALHGVQGVWRHSLNDVYATAMRASFQAEILLTWELCSAAAPLTAATSALWPRSSKVCTATRWRFVCRGRKVPDATRDKVVAAMLAAIDWRRYVEQMRIFMTPEHAKYIATQRLPQGLFYIDPEFGENRDGSFDPQRGYIGLENTESLGPVNGPYPIKDGERPVPSLPSSNA